MNIDEAAQYLGYRDVEHLEMQDLSEHSKWWELIKKLTSKDETELNLHLVSNCFTIKKSDADEYNTSDSGGQFHKCKCGYDFLFENYNYCLKCGSKLTFV